MNRSREHSLDWHTLPQADVTESLEEFVNGFYEFQLSPKSVSVSRKHRLEDSVNSFHLIGQSVKYASDLRKSDSEKWKLEAPRKFCQSRLHKIVQEPCGIIGNQCKTRFELRKKLQSTGSVNFDLLVILVRQSSNVPCRHDSLPKSRLALMSNVSFKSKERVAKGG